MPITPPDIDNPFRQLPTSDRATALNPLEDDVYLATRGSRLGARMVDGLFMFFVIAVGAALGGGVGGAMSSGAPGGSFTGEAVIAGVVLGALAIVVTQIYLYVTSAQSVGKRLLGIQVVHADGTPAPWPQMLMREAARLLFGCIPYLGSLISLIDCSFIFAGDRRTLHDRVVGTYVISITSTGDGVTLASARAGQAAAGGGGIAVVALVGVGGVFIVGVLAAIAIPNFITMQLKAKRSEVPGNVDGIRRAELAYQAAWAGYLSVNSREMAMTELTGKTQHPWPGGDDWARLGWSADSGVRGVYWVEKTAAGFDVHGVCDVDGDGEYAEYVATEAQQAQMITDPQTY